MSFFPLNGDYGGINDIGPVGRAVRSELYPAVTVFVHEIEFPPGSWDPDSSYTHYFSTKAMITGETDDPPEATFRELIDDPGTARTQVFSNGRSLGFVAPSWGSVTYQNTSGEFDNWIDYATDGVKITCRFGRYGDAYPAEYVTCFVAYIDGKPTVDHRSISFALRGRERIFEERVVTKTFDGDDPVTGGFDYNGTGIASGRAKALVMGTPTSFTPILLDDVEQLWFVTDGPPERIIPIPE